MDDIVEQGIGITNSCRATGREDSHGIGQKIVVRSGTDDTRQPYGQCAQARVRATELGKLALRRELGAPIRAWRVDRGVRFDQVIDNDAVNCHGGAEDDDLCAGIHGVLEQTARAFAVDPHQLRFVRHLTGNGGGAMDKRIEWPRWQSLLRDGKIGLRHPYTNMLFNHGRHRAVQQCDHLVPVGRKLEGEMPADETARARYQDAHGASFWADLIDALTVSQSRLQSGHVSLAQQTAQHIFGLRR